MKDQNLRGIGGWLAFLAASQILYILQHSRQALALLARDHMTAFAAGEIVANLSGVLLVLYVTVLLFRQRRTFPSLYLLQIWFIAGFHVLGVVLAAARLRVPHGMAIEIGLIIFNLMFAAIGTLYILKSVRVRNTFVL